MRPLTTRLLTGFAIAGALGFGVIGAKADSANGPDAGIGIPGYNVPYQYSTDGSGPGYPRHPVITRHYRKYGVHHYYRQY